MKKIDITKIPTLKTGVAIYGSAKHQEVGGAYCSSMVIALVTG